MSLYNQVNLHAIRYATEATKIFLMDRYKKQFPHYFRDAILDIGPATHSDFYVPPALIGKAKVVKRTALDELGCLRLNCFPFKEKWEPCTDQDPMQWVQVGQSYELACQPSCQEHTIHTEWTNNQCILANPSKKMVASLPEKLFGRKAYRHLFHGGLDVVDGDLKLNQAYCEAYGLTFVEDDCKATTGQAILEFFLGTTPIRAALTARVQRPALNPPTSIPKYLTNYALPGPRRRKKKKVKRWSTPIEQGDDPGVVARGFSQEIALELTRELGENVSEWAVQAFLKKKAPGLLVKMVDRVATKLVVKHSIATAMKITSTSALKMMSKGVSVVAIVYAVYDVAMMVVDLVDPLSFNKFFSKADLKKLNDTLDYRYYKDLTIRPELTPEYIWHYDLLTRDKDETEKFEFMVEKVKEYLAAIQTTAEIKPLSGFVWQDAREQKGWNRKLSISFSIVAICFVILFVEWIDVWTCGLLFIKVFFGL